MRSCLQILVIVFGVICSSNQYFVIDSNYSLVYNPRHFVVKVDNLNQETVFTVQKFGRTIHRMYLNEEFGKQFTHSEIESGFILHGHGQDVKFQVIEDSEKFSLLKVSGSMTVDKQNQHCSDLKTGHLNWFGGPEYYKQYWPIEKLRLQNFSYLTKSDDHVALAERYWLHSGGGFIYVEDTIPLFVDQNVHGNTICFISKKELPYNVRRNNTDLVYYLGVAGNAKLAQKEAVKHFLKKPTAFPDRRMVQHPIWSTWARYKAAINETTVDEFAAEIEFYGFDNSQFEIDDDWEVCYGALTFRASKFADIKKQTDSLRARGFRVTLWIHPFINKGCEPWYSEAKNNSFLVENYNGNPDTQWWNSRRNAAAHIDFTKPEAVKWFTDRLKTLQTVAGIDSFKFDAGETSWGPSDPKLNADLIDHPNALTKSYIRAVSQFGPVIEVRSGQGTQDLPIFVRMLDKDTVWTYNNGLPTLITTLLQMNMVGYGFVLPDMIGGNGYNEPPSEELFIRWLQANVFMPSLQFSYVPWDYSESAINISRKFTKLHADYTDEIMKAFDAAVASGEPVNPPIWWLDPIDTVALGISDEFLLGDRILSAPVINRGEDSRHIYLPKGTWYDPNLKKTYSGPVWLMDYFAPIDILPYFIRNNES